MTIPELMEQLSGLWPAHFGNQRTLEAWGKQYRQVLGDHQGPALQAAFNACMTNWTKASPPKPAEIAAHLNGDKPFEEREPVDGSKVLGKIKEDRYWADRVMKSEAGMTAVQHGFPRELFMWAMRNSGVWPDRPVMRRLYAAQRRHESTAANLPTRKDIDPSMLRGLIGCAEGMALHNDRLAQHYGAYHDEHSQPQALEAIQ